MAKKGKGRGAKSMSYATAGQGKKCPSPSQNPQCRPGHKPGAPLTVVPLN